MGADRQEQVCIPVPPKRRLAIRWVFKAVLWPREGPQTVTHRTLNIVADVQIGLCVCVPRSTPTPAPPKLDFEHFADFAAFDDDLDNFAAFVIALRTELDTTVTSGWVDAAKARQTLLTTMCVPIS